MNTEAAPKVVVEPITVDLETASKIVGLSTWTIQDLVRKGEFPAPRRTGRPPQGDEQ